MKIAAVYLGMAALGYVVATPLKKYKDKFTWMGKLLTFIVFSLVLCMGYKIGSNESVIGDIGTIGIFSLIMAVVPLAATVFGLNITRKLMGFDSCGRKLAKGEKAVRGSENKGGEKSDGPLVGRNTILYMFAVIAGFVFGYIAVVRAGFIDYEASNKVVGIYITYALYAMVFLVGVDMGFDGSVVRVFRETGLRVFAFPLATGISTLAAVFVCGIFMPYSATETLAIGCTFCWYSLAPNIIIDAGFVAAGAVAFLSNFLRVIISLLIIPIIAKKVGYIETTGMPVAAAMDVCIATIENATNKQTAMYAFASGAVYTVLIPIIVPIIVGA